MYEAIIVGKNARAMTRRVEKMGVVFIQFPLRNVKYVFISRNEFYLRTARITVSGLICFCDGL